MGIILTTTGLPLLTATGLAASRAALSGGGGTVPFPPPKPVSEFSYRGVTVTLSTPLPVYYSANGDPVIVSDAGQPAGTPISGITSMTPAGTTDGSGYRINGAVRNPVDPDFSTGQGLDEALGTDLVSKATLYTYDDALNEDPGNTGSAIPIAQGDAFTLVKAVRDGAADPSDWKMIEKYVVITVMGSVPPSPGAWFRPSISNPTKAWKYRVEDMNLTVFRNLAKPKDIDYPETYYGEILSQGTLTLPTWIKTGENGRRSQVTGETPGNGYASVHGRRRAEYALSLHIDPAGNQADIDGRRNLAIVLAQWGIDWGEAVAEGLVHSSGAGQYAGYIEFPYIAGFLFGDGDLIDAARQMDSNATGQPFWVDDTAVGFPTFYDSGNDGGGGRLAGQTYQSTDLDVPDWIKETGDGLGVANAHIYTVYRETWMTVGLYELLSIGLLRNGPGGLTGDVALIDGANDPSNPRAACFAYMDRSYTWTHEDLSSNGFYHTDDARAVYAAWRDEMALPRWTGRPDIPQSALHPQFSAFATGEIDFDFSLTSPDNHSTLPITDREIGVSQDGHQFIGVGQIGSQIAGTDPGANLFGTLTGLRKGTEHHCRWRQRNAAGWSMWSPTWPLRLPNASGGNAAEKAPRNLVTTAGGASGPLANRVAPVLLHKPYPVHEMPLYAPVTDATGVQTFYAGIGYWDGGTGALTATYQWQRDEAGDGNFSDIAGETSKSYARSTADSGRRIRCLVTVSDGASASQTVTSNAIGIPLPTVHPSTTIIDTDFTGEFPFDWPEIWNAFRTSPEIDGFTPTLLPSARMGGNVARGALWLKKSANDPEAIVDLTTTAPTGNYTVEIEIGGGFFPSNSADRVLNADIEVAVTNGSGAVRGDCAWTIPAATKTPTTLVLPARGFSIAGGDRTVQFRVAAPGSAGQLTGLLGGPVLLKLKISQET